VLYFVLIKLQVNGMKRSECVNLIKTKKTTQTKPPVHLLSCGLLLFLSSLVIELFLFLHLIFGLLSVVIILFLSFGLFYNHNLLTNASIFISWVSYCWFLLCPFLFV